MSVRARRLLVAAMAALLTVGTGVTAGTGPAHADARPTAAVAMGDSYASGEAAGDYDPATDRAGNFCHRSAHAEVNQVAVAAVQRRINLGCTGAVTDNVRLGGTPRFGEAPQAEQLRAVARDYQVQLITVNIGANDIPFLNLVLDCIRGYFLLGPRCQDSWASRLPAVLATLAPKVGRVLGDIRSVMRDAGYADSDYQLVLQSYAGPVTEENRYLLTKAFEGCPIRNDDSQWTRDTAAPRIAATLARVATSAGARFLDLAPAMRGHEVCAKGVTHAQEWMEGVNISLAQLQNGLGENLAQHSMHPNALGYAQLGRCLGTFLALTTTRAARCAGGTDGNLAAIPTSTTDATELVDTAPLPVTPEPPPPAE